MSALINAGQHIEAAVAKFRALDVSLTDDQYRADVQDVKNELGAALDALDLILRDMPRNLHLAHDHVWDGNDDGPSAA